MCRMMLGLGIKRGIIENARRAWMTNPHGWGLKYKYRKEWVEWHTVNSDVPIPTAYIPMQFEGLFHIRFATVNKKMGGVHPFTVGSEKNGIIYAHNGTIYPYDYKMDIDSETIGKYIEDASGNLKEKMIKAIKRLNDGHSGFWNIIAMTTDGKEAFGYCDGSLVEVFEGDNIVALASDELPFINENYKILKMNEGEWIYLNKEDGKWVIKEMGKEEKERWRYQYYGYYRSYAKNYGWKRRIYPDVTKRWFR